MATDLKGLESFRNKLEKQKQRFNNINSQTKGFVDEILQIGVQEAQSQYQQTGTTKVSVYSEKTGVNQGRVVAERKGLAYIEFGTGRVGEGSGYDEKYLPQSGVPITGKWDYYYDSEHKDTKDGVEGWYAGENFMTGIPAGMQMYKTARALEEKAVKVWKQKLKGDGTNV